VTRPEIQQLQDQQAYLTAAVRALLEGQWCGGPPSGQAFVGALDPNLTIDCREPILESETPPEINYPDPNESMPGQLYSWTCSACACDWLMRAYGKGFNPADIYNSREQTVYAIGYPNNINSSYGLMDGSGSQLQRVLGDVGIQTAQAWLTFDQVYAIAAQGRAGCMSGGAWYHWCGIRGVDGDTIWIANSAPGYMSVWNNLNRTDFNRLGPFSCVIVTEA